MNKFIVQSVELHPGDRVSHRFTDTMWTFERIEDNRLGRYIRMSIELTHGGTMTTLFDPSDFNGYIIEDAD